ncbi:hypothetical protein BDZ94DRAFT_1249627 [Collybia nuda]|uniref:Uncharacterized protein n=1 Tax=Collybia nuda TaxID=64659 RepID=A0A9P5YDZ8_9AGAR|nr:hypothetical protein BDZ94DRAFT_1249627 [Collybia nuda]
MRPISNLRHLRLKDYYAYSAIVHFGNTIFPFPVLGGLTRFSLYGNTTSVPR